MRLETWNVRSLTGPGVMSALILELRHYGASITAVQETKWTGRHSFKSNGFTVLLSNGERRTFGTGFIVDARWSTRIIDWRPIDGRICVLRVRGRFFNTSIINAHAPHNLRPEKEKDEFYARLEKTYKECPKHDIRIVIGDLNAQVGREEIYRPTIGRFSLHRETNENGLRLINFAAEHNMVISSTCFNRKNIHKATWSSPGSAMKSQIDHVLIDGRHASDVLNVRTYRCRATDIEHHDSDHFPVGATIRARLSNVFEKKGAKVRRIDVAQLQSGEKRKEFSEKLNQRLNEMNLEDVAWKEVRDAMIEVSEDVLEAQVPVKNEWFDDECREAVQAVIDARSSGRSTRSQEERIRVLQRSKKKLFRKKKRQFDQQKLSELEHLHSRNETRKFYQAINVARRGFQPRTSMCRKKNGELTCDTNGILACWKEHFEELLNEGAENCTSDTHRKPYETDDGKEIPPPSLSEVKDAINSLKNNKAPGDDSLPAELFKAGGERLAIAVHELIVRVWGEETLPEEWKTGVICPIFKKGCKLECQNYRGISLLPSVYKIFSLLIADRLKPLMESFLHPYQAGFRRGMSTSDQIFCIRQIIQKSHDMNTETDHLFIDFKAAYDSIDREQLWMLMAEFGFPNKMIRLLKATLTGVVSRVKVEGRLSDAFHTEIGLKQGDGVSTMLFNIALEGVIRRSGVEKSGSIFTKSTQMLGFADDIDIIGRNIRAVCDAYLKLEKEANRIGLRVNEDKTKFLMVSPSERTKSLVGTHLKVGDKRFEVVKQFTYLGALVNDNFDTSEEVKRRITNASKAFYGTKHILRSKNVSRSAKFNIYKTLIRPVAIYGCESWNTTDQDEERLGVFERKVLRTIIGPLRVSDGQYRIRYNHELYQIFRDSDIVATVKLRRLAWAGHVIRREEDRPVLLAFKGEFRDGKRSRGRPKNTWRESVDKDSASFGLKDWQKGAKDRTEYRRFLESAKARTRAQSQ
jgi:endonuclease/exonuclease/phosphatase family metal-dependent hydrolase